MIVKRCKPVTTPSRLLAGIAGALLPPRARVPPGLPNSWAAGHQRGRVASADNDWAVNGKPWDGEDEPAQRGRSTVGGGSPAPGWLSELGVGVFFADGVVLGTHREDKPSVSGGNAKVLTVGEFGQAGDGSFVQAHCSTAEVFGVAWWRPGPAGAERTAHWPCGKRGDAQDESQVGHDLADCNGGGAAAGDAVQPFAERVEGASLRGGGPGRANAGKVAGFGVGQVDQVGACHRSLIPQVTVRTGPS